MEPITDRDVNALESCRNWLNSKTTAFNFAVYKGLMQDYVNRLDGVIEKLKPMAVAKPVTMTEVFGKPCELKFIKEINLSGEQLYSLYKEAFLERGIITDNFDELEIDKDVWNGLAHKLKMLQQPK